MGDSFPAVFRFAAARPARQQMGDAEQRDDFIEADETGVPSGEARAISQIAGDAHMRKQCSKSSMKAAR
jgi:hypothetical protein